jgi:hypothetical protein
MDHPLEALRKALSLAQRRRRDARPALDYPLYPAPRVAVLGLELDGPCGVHCLMDWTPGQLARLRPQALAGWWNDLAEVARLVLAGNLELPDLQYPILVFSRVNSAPLPPRCHDLLWDWFRVSTFEQIRADSGELLAFECAARDGFHLAPGADAAALPLVVSPNPCPCGSSAPVYRIEGAFEAAAG